MITTKLLPINSLRRSGRPLLGAVRGIIAHDTGSINSTAMNNVDNYIRTANDKEASAHFFIDDINIIECIPATERALHVSSNPPIDNLMFGVNANDYFLGVELCYFTDKTRSLNAYNAYCAYIRDLCTKYHLDPRTYVVGHFQLNPDTRTDPVNAFKNIGKTWIDFIKDLAIGLNPTLTPQSDKLLLKEQIIKLLNQL